MHLVIVRKTIANVLEKHSKMDFLINNGGGQFRSELKDLSMNGFKAVVDLNLNGTFQMCREGKSNIKFQQKACLIIIFITFFFQRIIKP